MILVEDQMSRYDGLDYDVFAYTTYSSIVLTLMRVFGFMSDDGMIPSRLDIYVNSSRKMSHGTLVDLTPSPWPSRDLL